MAEQILMPRQGNTVESCVILEWRKHEGDSVSEGDVLCEVETDKATFEVEAPAAGTVLEVHVSVGDTLGTGAAIVTVEEVEATARAEELETSSDQVTAVEVEATPPPVAPADDQPVPRPPSAPAELAGTATAPETLVPASPRVRVMEQVARPRRWHRVL